MEIPIIVKTFLANNGGFMRECETLKMLISLVGENVCFLHKKVEGETGIYINCSNFFTEDFSGVDYCEIEIDEVSVVNDIYKNYGFDGIVAFCSHKKLQEPVPQLAHSDFWDIFHILQDRYFYA